jgi:hypothetical protein
MYIISNDIQAKLNLLWEFKVYSEIEKIPFGKFQISCKNQAKEGLQ